MSSGSVRAEYDTAVAALNVDRDTVLRARNVLMQEADRLDDRLAHVTQAQYHVRPCGTDPVSGDATRAFNWRIDALLASCAQHNADLREAARALDATARSYGWTDEEIATSFRRAADIQNRFGDR